MGKNARAKRAKRLKAHPKPQPRFTGPTMRPPVFITGMDVKNGTISTSDGQVLNMPGGTFEAFEDDDG